MRIKARCNGGNGDAKRLLQRFNKEEVRQMNKKYEQEHPNSQTRHREHGWDLLNDD